MAKKLGTPLTVEVLHDAAAAVLGEVSPKGTLPGCRNCVFIVWGTGVASGIISDGRLYWRDAIINMNAITSDMATVFFIRLLVIYFSIS